MVNIQQLLDETKAANKKTGLPAIPVRFISYINNNTMVIARDLRENENGKEYVFELEHMTNSNRITLAHRNNPNHLGYIKADPNSGGFAIMTEVKERGTIEVDGVTYPKATARWIEGLDKEDQKRTIIYENVLFSVGAFNSNGKNNLIRQLCFPKFASVASSMDEVHSMIGQQFNQKLVNVMPSVYLRIMGQDASGENVALAFPDCVFRPFGEDGESLGGKEAIAHLNSSSPSNRQGKKWAQMTEQVAFWLNKGAKVEVIPGMIEFAGSGQILNSGLFDGNGVLENKKSWLDTFKIYDPILNSQVPMFKEGFAAIHAQREHDTGRVYHLFNKNFVPVKAGHGSIAGPLFALETPNFKPGDSSWARVEQRLKAINEKYYDDNDVRAPVAEAGAVEPSNAAASASDFDINESDFTPTMGR